MDIRCCLFIVQTMISLPPPSNYWYGCGLRDLIRTILTYLYMITRGGVPLLIMLFRKINFSFSEGLARN